MPFHQGCDVTVAGAGEQIALPMAGNGAVFNLCSLSRMEMASTNLTLGLSASPSVH